ncbi:ROK family transcriptional regulator [soil metagenome]
MSYAKCYYPVHETDGPARRPAAASAPRRQCAMKLETAIDLTTEFKCSLGIEVGSRGLRAALVTRDAQIIESARGISAPLTAQSAMEQMFALVEQLLDHPRAKRWDVETIGVAFGGPVDAGRGVTLDGLRATGFESFPLGGLIEERFEVPVLLENDSRAAAIGEYRFGAGRGAHGLLYMQLGIGVGGGIVLNGRLLRGAGMTAGELGHMPVSATGPRCSCGKPGHLEAFVSEPALIKRAQDALDDLTTAETQSDTLSIEQVFADDAVEDVKKVASEATQMIGMATANIVTALSCDTVVLGGYAARIGNSFIGSVRARIRQYSLESALRRLIVSPAQLGSDAALLGATSLAYERLDNPEEFYAIVM